LETDQGTSHDHHPIAASTVDSRWSRLGGRQYRHTDAFPFLRVEADPLSLVALIISAMETVFFDRELDGTALADETSTNCAISLPACIGKFSDRHSHVSHP